MSAVSEPIPYEHMRRLLGLPDLDAGSPTRWAVRKIRTGERSGRWGVWRCPDPDTTNWALVESLPTWPDAIDRVRRGIEGTSATDGRSAGEHGRAGHEVIAQP